MVLYVSYHLSLIFSMLFHKILHTYSLNFSYNVTHAHSGKMTINFDGTQEICSRRNSNMLLLPSIVAR